MTAARAAAVLARIAESKRLHRYHCAGCQECRR